MNYDLWNKFKSTGSVFDYLNYKRNEGSEDDGLSRIEITNANYGQGIDNQRTDDRRE